MRIIEDGRDIEGVGIVEGDWPFRDHETLANLGNFGGSNWCLRLWWFGSLGDIWLWCVCVSEGQGLWYDLSNCLRLCVVS